VTYLKGKYTGANPLYVINGTVIKGRDLNATANFFIDLDEKLLQGNVNYTPGITRYFTSFLTRALSPFASFLCVYFPVAYLFQLSQNFMAC